MNEIRYILRESQRTLASHDLEVVAGLSRRAYSFRNFENYRMRVLAQCGWSGVINRA